MLDTNEIIKSLIQNQEVLLEQVKEAQLEIKAGRYEQTYNILIDLESQLFKEIEDLGDLEDK